MRKTLCFVILAALIGAFTLGALGSEDLLYRFDLRLSLERRVRRRE